MKNDKVDIICFGYDSWSSMWKREQSLVYHLSKKQSINRAIFVNPVLPLAHLFDRKRFKWDFAKDWRRMIWPRKVDENIFGITPFYPLPFTWRFKFIKAINAYLSYKIISSHLRSKKYLVMVNNPCSQVEPLVDIFRKRALGVIFDWADDWSAFEKDGSERGRVEKICQKYTKAADIVLTINDKLNKLALPLNEKSFVLHNATNYKMFSQHAIGGPCPELKNVRRPIIGYTGWIVESRIDTGILEYMSEKHPDWTLLFVGPVKDELKKRLGTIKNLVLFPPVDYAELPKMISNFDVCIIPNKINRFTDGNDPIKFFDYLASGKPIVSTNTAGAGKFKGVVSIAESREEFLRKVEEALEGDTREKVDARKEAAISNSWEKRAGKIEELIDSHIKPGVLKTMLFTTQYPPRVGGVPSFYYNLTKYFPKNRIVVFTAKAGGDKSGNRHDPKVYRTRLLDNYKDSYNIVSLAANLPLFLQALKVILAENVKIVIVGQSNIALLFMAYMMKSIFRIDYIIFLHGDNDSPAVRLKSDALRRYFYNKAKAFIVNSNFTKGRLQAKYGIVSDKISVIYPGVDSGLFTVSRDIYFNNEIKLGDKKVLLTVGRLDRRKGHDMVIRALPRVIKETPDFTYLIVGSGSYRAELERIASETGVAGYVQFLGHIPDDDLVKYYNICDLFVMPNRELEDGDVEGFGMVFLEANACGKPVIGGRSGGAVEAIVDNITGLLVDSSDPQDIAAKITRIFKDRALAKKMGEDGRKRVMAEFDWDRGVAPRLDQLQRNLFGEKKNWAH